MSNVETNKSNITTDDGGEVKEIRDIQPNRDKVAIFFF